jgi:hypothetical protein
VSNGRKLLRVLREYEPLEFDFIERYIVPNADTAFGLAHGFGEIRNYDDFVRSVPLQDYGSLRPWIERAAEGETSVLTAEDPLGFEITSGTSSASKWIPVTPGYQRELASALSTWMLAWERRYPGVFDGPTYWSLSPRLGEGQKTRSGLPLGFADDGAYFPQDVREGLGEWLVVPEFQTGDFFSETVRALLATPDLRAVSVWSPVFFLKLDAALGTKATWREIWPELRVVSCWADAQAALWKDRVIERLGDGVVFEPKGLLATEGVTTIPAESGNSVAKGVHFHEFIPCDEGRRHEVVLTTAAGLYRYRTGDLVEISVCGHVEFVGRAGDVSDLLGEKLDGGQVLEAFSVTGDSGFVRILEEAPGYAIFANDPQGVLEALRGNAHFARALDTGQLEPCRLCKLPSDWELVAARHLAESRGGREGDVKLPLLEKGEFAELWES